jgi:ABC-type multidrug transport system ATPase subunit
VSFSYAPGRPAVSGLSLRAPAGERVALVGRSGAGKSTVAALMARFYDPTSGRVLIDGRDARDCAVSWLRDQFGLVLQETMLFTGTVAENIAYGLEVKLEDVIAAARLAGAHEFIEGLPDGYETQLGPRGVALSGGQRQRIAIARVVLRDPPVLLLDEPTTGLDAESEELVLSGLEALMRDRTTIIISHSPRLARGADRVIVLEGGKLVDDGDPDQVLPDDGSVRKMLSEAAPPSVGARTNGSSSTGSPGVLAGSSAAQPQTSDASDLEAARQFNGRNPYVFVVGCPRSGTTLLQRMLDHHPDLAVANDTHFLVGAIRGMPPGIDPPLTEELVERALGHHHFHRLGIPEEAARESAEGSRTYREFISALYSHLAAVRGKRLAGEKSPAYVRHLPLLFALFPWARTIHIIRDGRDVALSTLDWTRDDRGPSRYALWHKEPIAVCALRWRDLVRAGRQDGARLGPARYEEVRYEDLVEGPEARLRQLSAFLEVQYATEMATYFEGRISRDPGLSAKKAWLPPTSGLRDWRTQMSEQDTELFEAIAGKLLSQLGYERAHWRISPAIAALAERCEAWWEMDRKRRDAKKEASARSLGLA